VAAYNLWRIALNEISVDKRYLALITNIKRRIAASQTKASLQVNDTMIRLYWDIGKSITATQKRATWGDGFLQQMSVDLQNAFPGMQGFSYRNLRYIKQWYLFWCQNDLKWQQVVAILSKLPWGHNLVIISRAKDIDQAIFYIQQTIENNWSRAVLTHQIESGLYQRQGKAITNFKKILPKPQSDLVQQIIKDPYNFDFLTIREKHDERALEDALVNQVVSFLLELGAGFSFVARQYKLTVDENDYYIDLLFYHARLHCYVVVELKAVPFKPEFAGKLNFYISAVDSQVKTKDDKPTIGILICKSKSKTVVEYTLRDIKKPIGVSQYDITKQLPQKFKSSLPTIEEIEAELSSEEN
jgi:predicted nuclease of restriction endonuclease-like (RecB) superfamily